MRVLRHLLTRGPQTAAAMAEGLALTSTAVRRHLDGLVRDGLVSASERAPYGPAARATRRGRGRPARVFTITAAGRDALEALESLEAPGSDSGYDALARELLEHLTEVQGPEAVATFAAQRAHTAGERYAASLEGIDGVAARVHALADTLSAEGYAASLTHVGAGGVQLCQHACPVAHVAEAHPEFCAAEAQMFSQLLGVNVTRLATMAGGAGVCTTHIPTVAPSSEAAAASSIPSPKEMA